MKAQNPAALALLGLLTACGPAAVPASVESAPPGAIAPRGPVRLFDRYDGATLRGSAAPAEAIASTELRFDGETMPAWTAGPGIGALAVAAGRLTGTSADTLPLVHLEVPGDPVDDDALHAVVVRVRASGGKNLRVRIQPDFEDGFAPAIDNPESLGWGLATPLLPGDDVQTYTLTPIFDVPTRRGIRHLVVRPVDEAGADFEIESIRLVFHREHMASLDSGAGWHGLGEIYHETLLARAGEALRFPVTLPEDPRLEFELGSLEAGALRFVAAVNADGARTTVLERTLTTSDRWQAATGDLSAWAGRNVELQLSLESELPGSIGLFGNPVVRDLGPVDDRPQGVIVVLVDTLRRDHLDVYGFERETAPHIARMAREGALFRDAISQGSWTKVSTPSLFTSLYQSSHGVTDFSTRLPSSADTLAEIFRSNGYATIGYSSVPFTGRFNNMHQGYETLHESTSVHDSEAAAHGGRSAKTAREFVDRFLPWLESHRDVPFFAMIHVFDPHDPFEPRSPYATLWADTERRAEHLRNIETVLPFIKHPRRRDWKTPTRAEVLAAGLDSERYISVDLDWYDGSIRGMDAEVGRLFERLRALGLADDVVVALVSDHGEEFHDHGDITHGHSLYREVLEVPLVIWGPGRVPAGTDVAATVETLDLMPTLLELAGLESPSTLQGRSLTPWFDSDTAAAANERVAIAERLPLAANEGQSESVAAVSGRWKLIHNTVRIDGRPEFELFDRVADPAEQHNVADAHPERVAALRAEIEAWRERTAALRLEADDDAAEGMDAQELERLRALGYVQ